MAGQGMTIVLRPNRRTGIEQDVGMTSTSPYSVKRWTCTAMQDVV